MYGSVSCHLRSCKAHQRGTRTVTGARWRFGVLVAFLGSWRSPENAPKTPRLLYFCRAAPLLILSKLPLTAPRPDLLKIEGVWEYSGQFVVYCPRLVFEHVHPTMQYRCRNRKCRKFFSVRMGTAVKDIMPEGLTRKTKLDATVV